jgi:hypothetical protein
MCAAAVSFAACVPSPSSQAPIPARSEDSLVNEIRKRHALVVDIVRLGDTSQLARAVSSDAILVIPSGDTLRGRTAIAGAVMELHRSLPLEMVRAAPSPRDRLVRCFDGVLDGSGEWSLGVTNPDSSLRFIRGPVGIQWVANGDSLTPGIIDLSKDVLRPEMTGCRSTAAARYGARRWEVFYSLAVMRPTTFHKAADVELRSQGYKLSNSPLQSRYPNGKPPVPLELLGVRRRVTDRIWLSASVPRRAETTDLGRCDISTYNHVHIHRRRQLRLVSLDYRWPMGTALGVGPAVSRDRYHYQEFDFYQRPPEQVYSSCGSAAAVRLGDSSVVTRTAFGATAHAEHQVMIAPNAGFILRFQAIHFPTAPGPTTAYGMPLRFRDLTTALSVGMVFTR